jgi:tRNA A-37 threonylcarbamoyl transferase component Bud32
VNRVVDHSNGAVAPFSRHRRPSIEYRSIDYLGWQGYADPECASPVVLDRFIAIHDAIRQGDATVFQDSGGRAVAMIMTVIQGRQVPLLVKEDDVLRSGIRTLLKSHLRPSRARVTWRRTIQLHAAGVAVQAPVALLELRRWGLLRKSVYVGSYTPNAVPIAHLLRATGGAVVGRDSLLRALASELRTMHEGGFYHGDLKDGNILAERRSDTWAMTFIDLENVTVADRISLKERAIDLGRLWLALIPLTEPADREDLLERYATVAPRLDSVSLRQVVMQRIEALQARRFGGLSDIGARLREEAMSQPASARRKRWVVVASGSAAAALDVVPLLAVLRRGFPTVRLEMLGNRDTAAAMAHNPDLDDIVTVSGRPGVRGVASMFRLLRLRQYQVAIDVTDTLSSALLTRATGARIRIGYRVPSIISKWLKRVTCYTHMIMARPEQRDRARYYLLVGKALGLDAEMPARRPDVDVDRTPA